jgi:hypothetical protein
VFKTVADGKYDASVFIISVLGYVPVKAGVSITVYEN